MGCFRICIETFICYAKTTINSYGEVSVSINEGPLQITDSLFFYRTLGPGADIILGRLSFDPNILIGEMTAVQLDEVATKFDQWPLRPRVLFEDASVFT